MVSAKIKDIVELIYAKVDYISNNGYAFDYLLEDWEVGGIFNREVQRVPQTDGWRVERMKVLVPAGVRDQDKERATGRVCGDEVRFIWDC